MRVVVEATCPKCGGVATVSLTEAKLRQMLADIEEKRGKDELGRTFSRVLKDFAQAIGR